MILQGLKYRKSLDYMYMYTHILSCELLGDVLKRGLLKMMIIIIVNLMHVHEALYT